MAEVTVLDGVLGEPRWGAHPDPMFLVVTDDVPRAARAVGIAAIRFCAVGDDGVEHPAWEELSDEVYTPNFVSPVYLTDAGLLVWTDCKGEVPAEMARAMLRVLVEELGRAGVGATVLRPEDMGDWQGREYRHPVEAGSGRAVTPSDAWFCVVRSVPSRTVDGRRYLAAHYWAAHGGWTTDPLDAARFDELPDGLVAVLAQQLPDRVAGYRHHGDGDVWPQPPPELRPSGR